MFDNVTQRSSFPISAEDLSFLAPFPSQSLIFNTRELVQSVPDKGDRRYLHGPSSRTVPRASFANELELRGEERSPAIARDEWLIALRERHRYSFLPGVFPGGFFLISISQPHFPSAGAQTKASSRGETYPALKNMSIMNRDVEPRLTTFIINNLSGIHPSEWSCRERVLFFLSANFSIQIGDYLALLRGPRHSLWSRKMEIRVTVLDNWCKLKLPFTFQASFRITRGIVKFYFRIGFIPLLAGASLGINSLKSKIILIITVVTPNIASGGSHYLEILLYSTSVTEKSQKINYAEEIMKILKG